MFVGGIMPDIVNQNTIKINQNSIQADSKIIKNPKKKEKNQENIQNYRNFTGSVHFYSFMHVVQV